MSDFLLRLQSFNTQPPEGGWTDNGVKQIAYNGFNTQPPEGGWFCKQTEGINVNTVSTHSRPKAAGTKSVPKYLQT